MRVIIAGAGLVGGQVLADLTAAGGHELVVVDADADRCDQLAETYDALVVHGDASDPDILENAQIGRADALVATTGSDPVNTVIAMLAHRFGIDKIVVKLTSNALRGALDEIGVTDVVAPTMAAAGMINAALQGVERSDLALLAEGGLQLAEVRIGASFEDQRVDGLDLPTGAMLVAVLHGEQAALATGGTRLSEGDLVLAIATTEEALEATRQRLAGG